MWCSIRKYYLNAFQHIPQKLSSGTFCIACSIYFFIFQEKKIKHSGFSRCIIICLFFLPFFFTARLNFVNLWLNLNCVWISNHFRLTLKCVFSRKRKLGFAVHWTVDFTFYCDYNLVAIYTKSFQNVQDFRSKMNERKLQSRWAEVCGAILRGSENPWVIRKV